MNLVTFLPFIVLIGAMFLMTRSAKNKQRQAQQMRQHMQPGSGVRTIGGMYATVKEVREDTVLLEVAPGTHALYAKNAVAAILEAEEYDRIVNAFPEGTALDGAIVPDDASSLTGDAHAHDEHKVDLGKPGTDDADDASGTADRGTAGAESGTEGAGAGTAAKPAGEETATEAPAADETPAQAADEAAHGKSVKRESESDSK